MHVRSDAVGDLEVVARVHRPCSRPVATRQGDVVHDCDVVVLPVGAVEVSRWERRSHPEVAQPADHTTLLRAEGSADPGVPPWRASGDGTVRRRTSRGYETCLPTRRTGLHPPRVEHLFPRSSLHPHLQMTIGRQGGPSPDPRRRRAIDARLRAGDYEQADRAPPRERSRTRPARQPRRPLSWTFAALQLNVDGAQVALAVSCQKRASRGLTNAVTKSMAHEVQYLPLTCGFGETSGSEAVDDVRNVEVVGSSPITSTSCVCPGEWHYVVEPSQAHVRFVASTCHKHSDRCSPAKVMLCSGRPRSPTRRRCRAA